ncbi:cobalamin ABC transporter substrate-binding protein [Pseudovibrio japonicus]|uniref:Cobalamin ABC transporter substrate-binding protein n=1 Tax=Pseudovibrio japonicus TaxID=366534 RepID=A0ABQ3DZH1_9HYPH|nr:ABC transporter substrate-binding protein [Pseudovibrio japonicus]GHB17570.1 cobalamin ABC transporter substrate-binding protein [Pseudovibrio japonicus]
MRNKIKKLMQIVALMALAISPAVTHADVRNSPKRVVSMNLCTDQFSMLLAQEGQLLSVSKLASDPNLSVMSEQAKSYPVNFGGAEEIYIMNPDLVIAGTYTNQTTVQMLRGLGIEVVQVPPVRTIPDIARELRRLGKVLGTQQKAEKIASQFEADVQRRIEAQPNEKPRAGVYYANGYTAGDGSLVHEVITTAGLQNIASNLGLKGTSKLPLELLVLEAPQLLVEGTKFSDKPALAFELLAHPALTHTLGNSGRVLVEDKYTICGLPFVTEAITKLADQSKKLGAQAE